MGWYILLFLGARLARSILPWIQYARAQRIGRLDSKWLARCEVGAPLEPTRAMLDEALDGWRKRDARYFGARSWRALVSAALDDADQVALDAQAVRTSNVAHRDAVARAVLAEAILAARANDRSELHKILRDNRQLLTVGLHGRQRMLARALIFQVTARDGDAYRSVGATVADASVADASICAWVRLFLPTARLHESAPRAFESVSVPLPSEEALREVRRLHNLGLPWRAPLRVHGVRCLMWLSAALVFICLLMPLAAWAMKACLLWVALATLIGWRLSSPGKFDRAFAAAERAASFEDFEEATANLDRCEAYALEPAQAAVVKLERGAIYAARGDLSPALSELRKGIGLLASTGSNETSETLRVGARRLHASALAAAGRFDHAYVEIHELADRVDYTARRVVVLDRIRRGELDGRAPHRPIRRA